MTKQERHFELERRSEGYEKVDQLRRCWTGLSAVAEEVRQSSQQPEVREALNARRRTRDSILRALEELKQGSERFLQLP